MYVSLVLEDIWQAAPMHAPTGLACKKGEIIFHHASINKMRSKLNQPNHSHYTLDIWEVLHVDACWYMLAPQWHSFEHPFSSNLAKPCLWARNASVASLEIPQIWDVSCYIIRSDSSFWSHKVFCSMMHTLGVSLCLLCLQGAKNRPICLKKPVDNVIEGWAIDPDPFSSRLYYDRWHSPNLPTAQRCGSRNQQEFLGWTPKNDMSPWISLKTREISLVKWEYQSHLLKGKFNFMWPKHIGLEAQIIHLRHHVVPHKPRKNIHSRLTSGKLT